jgi:aryl-alcohol dehydrogenase-like predicted oxidoreductase
VQGITAPIIGPRTFEQLQDLLGSVGLALSAEERARLEDPAPHPDLYPNGMLIRQHGLHELTAPLRRG